MRKLTNLQLKDIPKFLRNNTTAEDITINTGIKPEIAKLMISDDCQDVNTELMLLAVQSIATIKKVQISYETEE